MYSLKVMISLVYICYTLMTCALTPSEIYKLNETNDFEALNFRLNRKKKSKSI